MPATGLGGWQERKEPVSHQTSQACQLDILLVIENVSPNPRLA
jgi:hypothetical protein